MASMLNVAFITSAKNEASIFAELRFDKIKTKRDWR